MWCYYSRKHAVRLFAPVKQSARIVASTKRNYYRDERGLYVKATAGSEATNHDLFFAPRGGFYGKT